MSNKELAKQYAAEKMLGLFGTRLEQGLIQKMLEEAFLQGIKVVNEKNEQLEKQLGKAIYSIRYYCDTEIANRIMSTLNKG